MRIQKQEISAEVAKAQLRKGQPLEGCVIKGKLILSGIYESKIEINDCEFGEIITDGCEFLKDVHFSRSIFSRGNFNNTYFRGKATFTGINFSVEGFFCDSVFEGKCEMYNASFEHAEFGQAKFESEAEFSYAEFGELADFSRAEFKNKALFVHAKFKKGADFRKAIFNGEAAFEKAIFGNTSKEKSQDGKGDGFFNVATFHEKADFDGAKFHCHADFRRAKFKGTVEFRDVTVSAGVHFNYTTFGGCCDFKGSTFGKFNCMRAKACEIFNFNSVEFVESIDFSETEFKLAANFSSTEIGGKACFRLAQFGKADFSSTDFGGFADFSGALFRRQVIFQKATFADTVCLLADFPNGAQIEWDQLKGEKGKETQIRNSLEGEHDNARDEFGKLRKIFESNNDYDAMDRAYELFRHHGNMGAPKLRVLKWFNTFFLKFCTGYGTQPIRVLLAALGVIAIFAIIYAALGGQIFQPDGGYGWDFYLYFSLTTFFAGGVEGVHPDFEGGVKMLVAAETIMGYLLMALFVVMLTRKLTR